MALQFSMVYHPQMDGLAEKTNQTTGQFLQIHANSDGWMIMLPLVVMMMNTTELEGDDTP